MIEHPKVLLADSNPDHMELMATALKPFKAELMHVKTGDELLLKVIQGPDVIILNTLLAGTSFYKVIQSLKSNEETKGIPIVVITGFGGQREKLKAFELGANEFMRIPFDPIELSAKLKSLLLVKEYHDYMKDSNNLALANLRQKVNELEHTYYTLVQSHEKIKIAYLETIYHLSVAAEYRDEHTAFHIRRISHYSTIIARQLKMVKNDVEEILYASPMHDIGNIGVPDRILLKQGRLTAEEIRMMRQHTLIGAKILGGSKSKLLQRAETIALTHHERFDGKGYPNGLKGKTIPLEGHIVAVADCFDALTNDRSYRKAMSNERAYQILHDESGGAFDPDVVDAFFASLDEVEATQQRFDAKKER